MKWHTEIEQTKMEQTKKASYKHDVIAWSNQQAEFLRSGQFSELDLQNLAEEIEDVGKGEQRELASRMAVLLGHLIKWQYQPILRGASWEATIKEQRRRIKRRIKRTPSQKATIADPDWIDDMWSDGRELAATQMNTDITAFPDECPWTMEQALDDEFWPDD